MTAPEKATARIQRWKRHPQQFVTEVFGVVPELWQAEALQAIADNDQVAIRSGHGVGKSAWLSWLILWFLLTRYPAKVPCTAPTAHQLDDVLWAEIGKWHRRMPAGLRDQVQVKSGRVEIVGAPESFAVGRTARPEKPESFQGFHQDNLLFIVDEASGVADIIFETGEGSLSTPGAKIVMVGNPTRNSGEFYRAFHKDRELWTLFHVRCQDSSQAQQEYIDRQAKKYGVDSNVYRIRVLGEFAKQDDDVLIGLDLVEAAALRQIKQIPNPQCYWGVDIAWYGDDDCALVKREGLIVREPKVWRKKDPVESAGIIIKEYKDTPRERKPLHIFVDILNMGSGVVATLQASKDIPGGVVVGVNVAEAAALDPSASKLRDELWLAAREWFREGLGCLEGETTGGLADEKPTERLIGELSSVRYKVLPNGKLKVESKDDMKKDGRKSPDVADAFCYSFAYGSGAALGQVTGKRAGKIKMNMDWVA